MEPPDRLLDDGRLWSSSVVANCAMNRERGLVGVNSYARELGFDPLDALLAATPEPGRRAAWLDAGPNCTGQPAVHSHYRETVDGSAS